MTIALVLPSPAALLPPYSREDPVAELRAACASAVAALPATVVVVAPSLRAADRARGISEPLGLRVARHLLGEGDRVLDERVAAPGLGASLRREEPEAVVVVADGSASRTEKAPGHLHPAATGFDDGIETALRHGDAEALIGLDEEVAEQVWCRGVPAFRVLGELAVDRAVDAEVLHAESPYGVAWWVARWTLG